MRGYRPFAHFAPARVFWPTCADFGPPTACYSLITHAGPNMTKHNKHATRQNKPSKRQAHAATALVHMQQEKRKRGPYHRYDELNLSLALTAVRQHHLGLRAAEKAFHVPRKTIVRRLKAYPIDYGFPSTSACCQSAQPARSVLCPCVYGCGCARNDTCEYQCD